jgi:hypothetical protein
MLTGFRMTSVMRTSTLSSVTKHVGTNTTIRARIPMHSGVLASQSDEEFDQTYAEPLSSLPAGEGPHSASLGLFASRIETGRSWETKPKAVMISYELVGMDALPQRFLCMFRLLSEILWLVGRYIRHTFDDKRAIAFRLHWLNPHSFCFLGLQQIEGCRQ